MVYTPLSVSCAAVIKLRLPTYHYFDYTERKNRINFVFENVEEIGSVAELLSEVGIEYFTVNSVEVTPETITIFSEYFDDISHSDAPVQLRFPDQSLVFQQTINVPLVYEI